MAAPAPELVSENGRVTPVVPGGKTTASATVPASGAGLMTVRSSDELGNIATTAINNEITGAVKPLESQYGALGVSQDRARSSLQDMFGTINPYVAKGADNVAQSYDAAEASQRAIFTAATKRMSDLKQSRAQEAQALAQEMGGPVALSEFTAGMDDASQGLANLGAGQQLHTLGFAQAGVQEANAWQSRVMPLVQTEQQAKVRNYFEDQKKTIQDQITALKASAGTKIEQRKNELIVQERTFALQKTQEALDKLKSDRDWTATKKTLANDAKRIAQSDRQFKLQEAGVTGTLGGKPTLAAQQLTAQEKQAARAAGITDAQMKQHKIEWAAATKQAQATLAASKRNTWAQWLDVATNPQTGKTITNSVAVPAQAPSLTGKPDKSIYKDPASATGWSRLVTQTSTPSVPAIQDPTKLVDFLESHNVPKATAIRMVRVRFAIPGWKYGKADPRIKPNPKAGPPDPRNTDNPGP